MLRKRRAAKSKSRRSGFLRLNEEPPRALSFEDDDGPPRRAGDLRPEDEVRAEFPPSRVRQAGLTGASMLDGEVTADDLSPETLLDESRSHSPAAHDDRDPLDTVLSDVDESGIGGGNGLDEAEEAWADPIPAAEHARRQREANRLRREGLRSK